LSPRAAPIGRGAWLKSLRFEYPSVLARRDDLPAIKGEIVRAQAELGGIQAGLNEALEALGSGIADKIVAYGGLVFAGVGGLALAAGGPVTWLLAAGAASSIGGGGLAIVGSFRRWRRTNELERLAQRQRWLASETERYRHALERVSEAIELRRHRAALEEP
jgi:hypothetical protein